ncbi:acyltransferase [Synechococcus sp. AH-736-G20]|nr:acyltransferase [Synechococcus sp. AH-736-G20]
MLDSEDSVHANSASKTSRYRPEIDGLRAFAVVAVIINHFNKDILPGGYLGVDIFFVISGYVITSSLFGRPSKDFKDFISGFYERRIKRLVPALSVFVLITSIAICLFNHAPGLSLWTGITSLFGLSNLYLLKQSTDYFAQSAELNVFTHTWSLGVEEQFYILFPFLIWFSGFGRQTKNGARNLFLAVGSLTIASLVGFLYLYPTNQPAAYFLMPSRFWEMAAGCLIFIGFQKRASVEQLLERVPPLLLMALIVGVMYLPMSMAAGSTVAVVALSSILIASLKKQTAAFKVFTNPKVVYVGLISYSLYLWHWGVLSISRWTIGIHWWSVPFQIALMLGLAVASYRWIETPLRKGNWFGKRWKTLVVGGGVLVTLSGGLVALGKPLRGHLFVGNKKIASQIGRLGNLSSTSFASSNWSIKNCIYSSDQDVGKSISIKDCSLSPYEKKHKNLLVIGNSQNVAQLRMYEKTAKSGVNVILTSAWGCHLPPRLKNQNKWRLPCDFYQEKTVPSLLDTIREGDTVALISDFSTFSKSENKNLTGFDQAEADILIDGNASSYEFRNSEFASGIDRLSKMLNSRGISLIIQHMGPLTRSLPDIQGCVSLFGWKNKECKYFDKSEHIEARKDFNTILQKLARENSNVFIFDPFHDICSGKKCTYTTKSGILLFRDPAHFSDDASKMLSTSFYDFYTSIQ